MKGFKKGVEQILKEYPETRNSDIDLTLTYWWVFNKDKFVQISGAYWIRAQDIRDLPREDQLSRVRRQIQEEGKYPATDEKVAKKRRQLINQVRKDLGYGR